MRIIFEVKCTGLAMKSDLAEEETEGIEPREKHSGHDLADTLFALSADEADPRGWQTASSQAGSIAATETRLFDLLSA